MTPLDCSQVDELLLDFLYDELPAEEARAVEQHLAGCPRCAAEVAGFRRVRQAARALPVEEPSPLVTQRLLEAAAGRNVVPLPRRGAPAEGTAAASAATPKASTVGQLQPPVLAVKSVGGQAPEGGPPTGDNSASVAAQVIDAAKARARRWYAHPAWSVAALFAVGLAGTTWMLATRPDAVTRPVPASAPSSDDKSYPAAAAAKEPPLPATMEDSLGGPGAADDRAETGTRQERERPKPSAVARVANPEEDLLATARPDRRRPSGRAGDGVAGLGTGAAEAREALARDEVARDGEGAAGGGLNKGRTSPAPSAAQPAPQRPPSGHGQWLDPETKVALEQSIEKQKKLEQAAPASPPADPAPPREAAKAPAPKSVVADTDDASPVQGGSRFAPPPPPMPMPPPRARPPATRSNQAVAAADAPAAAAPAQEATDRSSLALEEAGKAAGHRAKADAEQAPAPSALARFQGAYQAGDCAAGLARYQELRRSPSGPALGGEKRLWVARCLARAGDFAQARREAAGLRQDQPEWATSVDELLATIDSRELTQRRAAESAPAAGAKAARPAKAKAAPASPASKDRQGSPAE